MSSHDTLTLPAAGQGYASAILGPPFMGWTSQILFAGLFFSMTYNYCSTAQFSVDPRRVRYLLASVTVCVLAQSVLSYYAIYHYGTWQIRDENTLYGQTLADCFTTLPAGLVAALVQTYLVLRASALFKRPVVRALFISSLGLVILGGLLGAVFYVALSFLLRSGEQDRIPAVFGFASTLGLWSFCSAFVDLVISVSLVCLLKSKIMRSTVSAQTDGILRRLIHLSVATAIPTTLIAVIAAACSFAFPDYSLGANSATAFWLTLPSLYGCSFISTLAARERIRADAQAPSFQTRPPLSPYLFHNSPSTSGLQVQLGEPHYFDEGQLSPHRRTLQLHPVDEEAGEKDGARS